MTVSVYTYTYLHIYVYTKVFQILVHTYHVSSPLVMWGAGIETQKNKNKNCTIITKKQTVHKSI